MGTRDRLIDAAIKLVRDLVTQALDPKSKTRSRPKSQPRSTSTTTTRKPTPTSTTKKPSPKTSTYPGDFTRRPRITYTPKADRLPDPGEVVWTWVPFEEDHSEGKDRPVLLIARDGDWLLGLQVTSQDHDIDRRQEARAGRYWIDIGTGAWDSQRRASEARVNRILRIDPSKVRRIGAILDQDRFDAVKAEVLKYY